MLAFRKRYPLLKFVSNSVYDLPCPLNLTIMWTFGSMLGFMMVSQIVSGFLLSFHYFPDGSKAFLQVAHIERDVNAGWFWRGVHANGASVMMLFMYIHMARGIYFDSYSTYPELWRSGALLFVATMAVCFLGYVLPWGQMSYWGATVITNLFSVVPGIGDYLVRLMWGGYTVGSPTLNRFYSFHFLLPLVMVPLVVVHLFFLHKLGSSNPLGVDGDDGECVPFHPSYTLGDLGGVILAGSLLCVLVFEFPYLLGDPENFIPANPLLTPVHIKPEWYFLPFYAILRSIPHKSLGVLAMAGSIGVLFVIPSMFKFRKFQGVHNIMGREFFFWGFVANWVVLGWIGGCPIDDPFLVLGQIHMSAFFVHFIVDLILVWGSELEESFLFS